MDTADTTGPRSSPATPGPWRPLLAAAGVLTAFGGSMHAAPPEGAELRESLASMTADAGPWVLGHGLTAIGVAVLAVGLVVVRRSGAWPTAAGILPFAAVAAAVNAVELVLHTASVIDHDRLADGRWAPVTVAHLIAAVVANPLLGVAVVLLAWRLLPTWSPPLRIVSVVGLVGGLGYALAAPLTFTGVDGAHHLFAVGGIATSLWLLGAAASGSRSRHPGGSRPPGGQGGAVVAIRR